MTTTTNDDGAEMVPCPACVGGDRECATNCTACGWTGEVTVEQATEIEASIRADRFEAMISRAEGFR